MDDMDSNCSTPNNGESPLGSVSTPGTPLSISTVASASKDSLEIDLSQSLSLVHNASKVENICCVGAGYVGGPTAAVIAFHNPEIRVTVVDRDAARVRKWNSKHLPIYEPGLIDVVRVARDGRNAITVPLNRDAGTTTELPARLPNLFFSTEVSHCISEADIIFLSVNTNTKSSGFGAGSATNMAALEGAAREIAVSAKSGAIIVEKSTVPCRTAQIVYETLQIHRPGVPFEILSNPEFLAEGSAIKDLFNPDRILIGSLREVSSLTAAATLMSVYTAWVDPSRVIHVNLWSSELSKLVANAMLAQRISSINTISAICERTGADIDEITHSIGLDPRIGPKFLKAGLGFGGSCFKKDILSLTYLARSLNLPEVADYWLQVLDINEYQRDRFVKRVLDSLNGTLQGKKIAILGYAFKENTSDTRESCAAQVVASILADNPKEIAIFDPKCNAEDVKDDLRRLFSDKTVDLFMPEGPIEVYANAYDACLDASAVLILTGWDQFRYPSPASKKPASTERRREQSYFTRSLSSQLSELDGLYLENHGRGRRVRESEDQQASESASDCLTRYVDQPQCAEGCRDCSRGPTAEVAAVESVDWARISDTMQRPRWVFDGRGVVDVKEMEKLGFRVEAIGKAGTRSRLNGFNI